MTVDMSDFDRAIAKYEEKMDIAKKMLKENIPIEIISKTTGLPEEKILDLK